VTDPVKLLAYRILDPVKAQPKPEGRSEPQPEAKTGPEPEHAPLLVKPQTTK